MGLPIENVRIFHGLDRKDKRRDWKAEGKGQEDLLHLAEKVNLDTLVKTERVNELISDFTKISGELLDDAFKKLDGEVGLVAWIKNIMFQASEIAFMGTRVFEETPDFEQQFWDFDRVMLELYFGLPRFVVPSSYSISDSIVSSRVLSRNNTKRREGKTD